MSVWRRRRILWARPGEAFCAIIAMGNLRPSSVTPRANLREAVLFVPTDTLVDAAFELAVLTSITIYDALYIALAISQDCAVVTADLRLENRLRGGPLARHVISLGDWRSRSGM